MIAVDLKHRLLWWSHDDRQWGFVPSDSYERRFTEITAWRAVALSASDALSKFLVSKKDESTASPHFARFQTIQDTFMRMQGFSCAWQGG